MKKINKANAIKVNGGCSLYDRDSIITATSKSTKWDFKLAGTRIYTTYTYYCGKCYKKCTKKVETDFKPWF
jgi:hypothetical protein